VDGIGIASRIVAVWIAIRDLRIVWGWQNSSVSSSATRLAGILLPAFSPRRDGDLGIGDTEALRQWVDWAADHGVGFIQLLPINENGPDESPYSAISSSALDPIYLTLDGQRIPWLGEGEFSSARVLLGDARDALRVDYPAVRRAKRNLLELAWTRFDDAGGDLHEELAAFRVQEADWLADYCLFRLLMEMHGDELSWDRWPRECRTPRRAREYLEMLRLRDAAGIDYRLGFFAFVQWLCHRQWDALRRHADVRGVMLMGDMPIGVSWHSSDVFFQPEEFHLEWCGGSPPEGHHIHDPFFQQWGQNWGIPLYRWEHMHDTGFSWWKVRVRRLTRIFRMFRIDHILGFYRIYAFPWHPSRNGEFTGLSDEQAAALTHGRLPRWFPRPDDTLENKSANLADGDQRLRAVIEAAGDAEIIAEDLGWVPDYVRPHLHQLGIAGYRIPHWDCDSSGQPVPGDRFPENSFAAYSTHDHDPVNGIWRGCLEVIRRHGESPSGFSSDQADGAHHALRILSGFAGIPVHGHASWPQFTEGIRLSLIKALMASKSRYAELMITELFDIDERINRPGTVEGNWCFRLPWAVEQIMADRGLSETCRKFAAIISITGRAP
jgi:4-alpha-glucanotransferase